MKMEGTDDSKRDEEEVQSRKCTCVKIRTA
jgi:hypothetical protein